MRTAGLSLGGVFLEGVSRAADVAVRRLHLGQSTTWRGGLLEGGQRVPWETPWGTICGRRPPRRPPGVLDEVSDTGSLGGCSQAADRHRLGPARPALVAACSERWSCGPDRGPFAGLHLDNSSEQRSVGSSRSGASVSRSTLTALSPAAHTGSTGAGRARGEIRYGVDACSEMVGEEA